jgi:methyltransferase (TIGR00027 family)
MSNIPDNTAVRVALWRAIHVQIDSQPHVLEDEIGLKLVDPAEGWRQRPDMDPNFTRGFRAAIVSRARFIEDLVFEKMSHGLNQYVILGAGLDTFAQRRPDVASKLQIFEIDQPLTQAWKQQRLTELGFSLPSWLHFVPVDFETGRSWQEQLVNSSFDKTKPALVSSTGVSMYLTKEANAASLRQIATLAPGTTLAMTFLLPKELIEPEDRLGLEISEKGARASGTPFLSFFEPNEIMKMAREAGFSEVRHVSGTDLTQRYFAGRADDLRPSSGENLLIATV